MALSITVEYNPADLLDITSDHYESEFARLCEDRFGEGTTVDFQEGIETRYAADDGEHDSDPRKYNDVISWISEQAFANCCRQAK